MRIRRLPQAIRDVDQIFDRVAADNMAAARKLAERITHATGRLVDFPHSGTPRPDIDPGLRSIVVDRYLVFYRVGPDSVDIIRVVHGARELGQVLGGEDE